LNSIYKNIDTFLMNHPFFSSKDEENSTYHFYLKKNGTRTKASIILRNRVDFFAYYESHSVDFSFFAHHLSETDQWFQDIFETINNELKKFDRIRKVVGLH